MVRSPGWLWFNASDHRRRRLLPVDAAVPLQRADGGLVGGVDRRCGDGAGTFSASGLLDDLRHYGVTYLNYVGKPLACTCWPPPNNPTTTTTRCGWPSATRGHRPRHRRPSAAGSAARCAGRLQVHRGRGHHHPEDDCPPGQSAAGSPVWRSTTRNAAGVRDGEFDASGAWPTGRRRSGRSSTPPAAACSAATTTTQRHRRAAAARDVLVGDLGFTATRTGGSTWPAAPRTGCASTARTWRRPHRTHHSAAARGQPGGGLPVPDEHVGDRVMAAIVLQPTEPSSPPEFGDFLAAIGPTCPQRRGRGMSGSPIGCQATATNKGRQAARRPQRRRSGGRLWTVGPRGRGVPPPRTAE